MLKRQRTKNRRKKIYNREWKKLVKKFNLKPSLYNPKKIAQALKKSEPYIVNPELGKWYWTQMGDIKPEDYYEKDSVEKDTETPSE